MDIQELLLLKLIEECNEVSHCCSKIIQFGPNEVYNDVTNIGKLRMEIIDLKAVIKLLGIDCDKPDLEVDKVNKIIKYARYSKSLGKLTTSDQGIDRLIKIYEYSPSDSDEN